MKIEIIILTYKSLTHPSSFEPTETIQDPKMILLHLPISNKFIFICTDKK